MGCGMYVCMSPGGRVRNVLFVDQDVQLDFLGFVPSVVSWLVVLVFQIRGRSAGELKLPREGKRSGGYMTVAVARTRERVREASVGRKGK